MTKRQSVATSERTGEQDTSAIRIGVFYAALFAILGLHLPYLPLWLDWAGLTSSEIAIVLAVPLFLRLGFAPVIAVYADAHHAHRLVILALAAAAMVTGLVLMATRGFWPIFLVALLFTLSIATIMPLIETVAVASVKSKGHDYGRMRLWGSLSFVAVGFAGGWMVDGHGDWIILPMLLVVVGLTWAAGFNLPRQSPPDPATRTFAQGLHSDDARRLALNGLFLTFLVSASTIQGAHGLFYTFGALHWQEQGLSTTMVGTLWALGIVAEVLLFAWSGAAVALVGPVLLLIIGGAAAVVRWMAMSFDPGLALLIPLQILHGATYGATHLGAVYFIARSVPESAAGTAQALYGACAMGVATGAATLISGPLYDTFQGRGYAAMAVLAVAGLAAAVVLRSRWSGGLLWGDDVPDQPEREAELGPKFPVGPNV